MSRSLQRFEPRILILFLLLGWIPPVIGHVLLVAGARDLVAKHMQSQAGQRADDIQRELASLIEGAVLQVSNLANSSILVQTAREADRVRPSPEELQEIVLRVESDWPALLGDTGLLRRILEHRTSQFLRRQNEIHATFREILVTDAFGRLIAATNKTSDYYQADEQWWLRTFLQGTGASYVGDLVFEENANSYGIEIAEPIHDDESGTVIGVVKGILDSPALFSRLEDANFGTAEETLLVRLDGTIVWGPEGNLTYPYAEQLRTALSLHRRSFVFSDGDRELLVGLPPSGINARVPELDWYVVVQHDRDTAMAPMADLNSRFLVIVAVTVVVTLVLAMIFTRMLSKPVIEIDPHFDQIP